MSDLLGDSEIELSELVKKQKAETEYRFKKFWLAYPRKEGKKTAWDKFNRLSPDVQHQVVELVVERADKDAKWLAGYVPMPATFFNQERWHDEYEVRADKKRAAQHKAIEQIICSVCKSDTRAQRHRDICIDGVPMFDVKSGKDHYRLNADGSGVTKVI